MRRQTNHRFSKRPSPAAGLTRRGTRTARVVQPGRARTSRRRREPGLHREPFRTYNIDRNINYTNVCTAAAASAPSRGSSASGRLCHPARRIAPEDRGDHRPGRRPNPVAGRDAPRVEDRLVRKLLRDIKRGSRRSTSTVSARRRSTISPRCRGRRSARCSCG